MKQIGSITCYTFYFDGKKEKPYIMFMYGKFYKDFKTRNDMAKYYKEHCIL
jgi:hypothetical protein